MSTRSFLVIVTSFLLAGISGCDDSEEPTGADPRLSMIQAEIFTPSCTQASCHDADGPESDLDLTEGASHGSLVGVSGQLSSTVRVVPGDPDNSLLIQALEGTAPDPIRSMPIGLMLEQDQIDIVRQWIEDGAAND